RERTSSTYERSFAMKDIDEENIKATFENGVLTLELPKKIVKEIHGKDIPIG
ncbi:MAG: Hsp20 family protein, partial [Enterococcus sp.]